MSKKYFFPHLKSYLSDNGIKFVDFVRAVQSEKYSMGMSLSERTFHNATNKKIGVSGTSKNSIARVSEKFFEDLGVKDYQKTIKAIDLKNKQGDLFES